ncbi:MAG TPA: methyltransferase domain-containing protein [Candidatus Binataceae bacterium]|nr:methyltransferase domain-containing protein [Candidatus Binataceae bacterium]
MDPALYPRMAALEDAHWWFAGRRAICESMFDRMSLPPGAAILEPGCGTGGNFPMLARRGKLYAIDADQSALGFAASRGLAELARGSLPGEIPFGNLRFDLAVMTDVLEHLDDPAGSLHAVRLRLKRGGWLLLTVPALQWLWSQHDATHHHRRRYRARELRELLGQCGFTVEYLTYYNFVLFPAIAAVRLFHRLRGSDGRDGGHDLAMPPRAINGLLLRLFASERYLLGTVPIPIGVSLIALARA